VPFPHTREAQIAPVGEADYNMSMPRRAAVAISLVCVAAAFAVALARSQALHPAQTVSPLTVIAVPTPRLAVRRYDTSGTYPQVRSSVWDLRQVNASLRRAVFADQRKFAPRARRGAVGTAKWYRGVYRTSVDRRLISASTVVVSALMPATEQYPGGSLGKGWLASTVRVPTGAPVTISDLFANPSRGLRVLAKAWKSHFPRTDPCIRLHLSDYLPMASNYRHFALTPRGLAVGFWQEAACSPLHATVQYAVLRPYLSELGTGLIAAVRNAR
jgi:hypothetical protein